MARKFKKAFFGPLKLNKPFLLFKESARSADLAFYQGYDPHFLSKKASALFAAYNNPEAYSDFARVIGWSLDMTDGTFLGALATEIHCATFHQVEGLLALLLAEYQDRPDWVYLSAYGTKEVKEAARAIAEQRFGDITCGTSQTAGSFVATAVYATLSPDGAALNSDWQNSLTDIGWFIRECAEEYLDGLEFNAYKHGLRVISGPAVLAAKLDTEKEFKTIASLQRSLSYLEMDETPEGYVAEEVTIELNPEYSYQQITIAAKVLSTIRDMRISRLTGNAKSINLLALDRKRLSRLKPVTRLSFSY